MTEIETADAYLSYVLANSTKGDPDSVVKASDKFGYEEKWVMAVGDKKGEIVDGLIREKMPKVMIEVGGYLGYSAVRFGKIVKEGGGRYFSFELNSHYAGIARQVIAQANLADVVTVIEGSFDETVRPAMEKFGIEKADFVFIDHWKERYVQDFKVIEGLGILKKGSVVVADNALYPGAPDYLEYMASQTDKYDTRLIRSFLEYSDKEDGLEVSVCKRDI